MQCGRVLLDATSHRSCASSEPMSHALAEFMDTMYANCLPGRCNAISDMASHDGAATVGNVTSGVVLADFSMNGVARAVRSSRSCRKTAVVTTVTRSRALLDSVSRGWLSTCRPAAAGTGRCRREEGWSDGAARFLTIRRPDG